jgi:hypothetical protein
MRQSLGSAKEIVMPHVRYLVVTALAACVSPQSSVITKLRPVPLESAGVEWGSVLIDVRGVKPELVEAGQLTLTKRTTPWEASRTARVGQRFDSVTPGSYEIRVHVLGYDPVSILAEVRAGQVLHLGARMRRSTVQLVPVAN